MRDPRTGRYFASVTSGFYGPRVMLHRRPDGGEWQQADGPRVPRGRRRRRSSASGSSSPARRTALVYAGVAPAALFAATDGGETWELNRALWNVPTRADWHPGAGGLALHSICPWPGDPDRLAVGISAAGVWLTRGSRRVVAHRLQGPRARRTSPRTHARARTRSACTTCTARRSAPNGCSCSSTAASTAATTRARRGTTSRKGCRRASASRSSIDPADPDSAFVIPLVADVDRVTPDGKVRVYETRDAGASWTAHGDGLPQDGAYLTILRQAFDARRRLAARPLLRGDVGRRLRLTGCRRDLVPGRDEARSRSLGSGGALSRSCAGT